MGFMAPLYIIGMLAIGVPILLHLIKRTPQGRQMFSSLMFLSASPPRLTRRSRLTNLLLLMLRAAALIILAMAFARPYFHWGDNQIKDPSSGRRVIFLVESPATVPDPINCVGAIPFSTQVSNAENASKLLGPAPPPQCPIPGTMNRR